MKDTFNDLEISIDWLEYTLFNVDVVQACDITGLKFTEFEVSERGGLGYKKTAKHCSENVYLYWCGNENMGVHIRVSGSAIAFYCEQYINKITTKSIFGGSCVEVPEFKKQICSLIFSDLIELGKITRLDLALDDKSEKYYTTDDVIENLSKQKVVSKFRSYQNINQRSISDNSSQGHTIYFGSRKSDVMLRLYDKAKEQKQSGYWYRWEFEVKNERSNLLAYEIIKRDSLGAVFSELLNNYIRFVESGNRRDRCSTQQKWEEFIHTTQKLKLSIHKQEKTIDDKKRWIEKQCMPTIAGIVKYELGDLSFFTEKLSNAYERNSYKNKKLYEVKNVSRETFKKSN